MIPANSTKVYVLGLVSLMIAFTFLIFSVTLPVKSAHQDGVEFVPNSTLTTDSIRRISLKTNDIVYNPADSLFYASLPSSVGSSGNSLVRFEPLTGQMSSPVFVGSEPSQLALSSDGQSLYVLLDGAHSVRRYDTATNTPGLQFFLGRDPATVNFRASDIVVAPDNPNVLAVARTRPGFSPTEFGVAVFDNGVQRPQTGPGLSEGSSSLAFSANGTTLFGTGPFSGLKTLTIDATGVTVANSSSLAAANRIRYENGLIFSSAGQVIDASTRTLLGTFAGAASPAFVSDTAAGRAFYLVKDSSPETWILKAYDVNGFGLIGTLTISGIAGEAQDLVRWGTNGLAFRTTAGQFVLVQTSLIPTPNPLPTPSESPTATPTPTPPSFSTFTRRLMLPANDLVYDAASQKIFAAVGSGGGAANGNSVTRINPQSGALESSVFAGSEPARLALAGDGQTLYAGLSGGMAVQKIDVSTMTTGSRFSLGSDPNGGPFFLSDLAVAPDNPNLVAVARASAANQSLSGIVVFDNGIKRPGSAPLPLGGVPVVGFGATGATLYGGNYTPGLTVMNVSDAGVAVTGGYPFGSGSRLKYSNGFVYGASGQVINPATGLIIGTFQLPPVAGGDNLVVPDPANGKVFFLTRDNQVWQLRAFDINTFLPLGVVNLGNVLNQPRNLIRWGGNGLAFTEGNFIHFVQTSLVDPNETVPEPTPTPTATPTPLPPTPPATFVRRVELPINDLVYNQPTGSLYAAIPGTAAANRANTITRVKPETGEIESSAFVGVEPKMLALADDGETLYVKIDGANVIRRFNAATQTPGAQFTVGNFSYIQDMAVMPGNPQSLVLAQRFDGVGIYDNGVRRPNMSTGGAVSINRVETSANGAAVYGFHNESMRGDLVKFGVDGSGVNFLSRTANIVGGFGNDIKFSEGLLYTNNGAVIDAETQTYVGLLAGANLALTVDPVQRRAYSLSFNELTVYDIDTFLKVGSVTLPRFTGFAASLVRWGANGLAFRVYGGSNPADNRLYIVQSAVVSPTAPVPTGIEFTAATSATAENGQNIMVSVLRTGDLSGQSTVSVSAADGTATAGLDYGAVPTALTFEPGESRKNIVIPVINDNIFEGSETFNLTLGNPVGGELLSPSSAAVTITDDDFRPSVSVVGTIIDEPPPGGNAVTAAFTLQLTHPTTETVSVNFGTGGGTATPNVDYLPVGGILTFNPLETSKTVEFTVYADGQFEWNENFLVLLFESTNAPILTAQASVIIRNYSAVRRARVDFDGDNRTDLSIFRPTSGEWWYLRSSDAENRALQFGLNSDLLTPGDFTGDGKTDVAVFRPASGEWLILRSEDNTFFSFPFGSNGDVPAPSDYDGDGRQDVAVFRPAAGTWYVLNSSTRITSIVNFGTSEDKPVPADFDGDGKADIAIFRPSDGSWWYLQSSTSQFRVFRFGLGTDKPVPGDYTGDGRADIAVFRPATGEWFFQRSEDNSYYSVPFGADGDVPVPGDYDGDGRFDTAVFRPSSSDWYVQRSTAGILIANFGINGDQPVPGAFVP